MARAFLLGIAEEERRKSLLKINRRFLRDTNDPLQLPEIEFISNFRLTKDAFLQVLNDILPLMPVNRRSSGIRNELKLLATLSFLASGSYQRNIGASFMCNMSQPSFSKCLHAVVEVLNDAHITSKYIKFPASQTERELIMRNFMEKFGFPGVIGCIDGTHIAIICPKEHEETFFNRKHFHSLNAMIICDANLNILHIDPSFGGAAHDSLIWNQSIIKRRLENIHNREHCWFLGDSGYAQRPWMMTPILGAVSGSPEENYTDMHCRTRNAIERCIGVLKGRWRCLLAHRVLHYEPITAAKIVNACAVLHNVRYNIAIAYATPMPDVIGAQEYEENFVPSTPGLPDVETRDILVQRLWNARDL